MPYSSNNAQLIQNKKPFEVPYEVYYAIYYTDYIVLSAPIIPLMKFFDTFELI